MTSGEILEFVTSLPEEQMVDFDWRPSGQNVDDDMTCEPFKVAKIYLDDV